MKFRDKIARLEELNKFSTDQIQTIDSTFESYTIPDNEDISSIADITTLPIYRYSNTSGFDISKQQVFITAIIKDNNENNVRLDVEIKELNTSKVSVKLM